MALTKPDRDIVDIAAGMKAGAELTVATGAITLAENAHAVDTEADAASDDLDTINAGPVQDGAIVMLYAADAARTVMLKHGTGNIRIQGGGDVALDDAEKSVLLRRDGAYWRDVVTVPPAGGIVQVVQMQTGAVATGTTMMPIDDTIPQNTEGDQYLTLAITPTSAANQLMIEAVVNVGVGTASYVLAALFQDTTANALAAVAEFHGGANGAGQLILRHRMAAGAASPMTFKIRAGLDRTGTTTFNGYGGARKLGGVMLSSLTITEIAA